MTIRPTPGVGAQTGLLHLSARPREAALARLGARQHGVVTVGQLSALGLSADAVRARTRAARLHRIHRGVYAVGHPGLTFEGRALAAVMAAGAGAALSHRAAAALHRILPPITGPCDVTTSRRTRHGPVGVVLHRARTPPETIHVAGIPVTTLTRTLVHLAATRPRHELERALREAHARRVVTRTELLTFVARAAGAPGVRALREALGDAEPARSELERRFLALAAQASIAPPEVGTRVAGVEADFLWRTARIVVETDGYATHATRHGFERDRERDARLETAGWRVLRFSWRQVTERPDDVIATLRAAIG